MFRKNTNDGEQTRFSEASKVRSWIPPDFFKYLSVYLGTFICIYLPCSNAEIMVRSCHPAMWSLITTPTVCSLGVSPSLLWGLVGKAAMEKPRGVSGSLPLFMLSINPGVFLHCAPGEHCDSLSCVA